jgi:D-glycero-D-manno-heptose 1,7-bisphosphate phosphatase
VRGSLIILDRDGVINQDSDDYIKSAEEWLPIAGSLEAMARLQQAGYTLAIATNQSGISRGYYSEATLDAMHAKLQHLLAQHGGTVSKIAYCPHLTTDECECRKPKPGMLQDIIAHFGALPPNTLMVGDSLTDWQAAQAAGIAYVQVRSGKGERTLAKGVLPADIPVFDNLADYADSLLGA